MELYSEGLYLGSCRIVSRTTIKYGIKNSYTKQSYIKKKLLILSNLAVLHYSRDGREEGLLFPLLHSEGHVAAQLTTHLVPGEDDSGLVQKVSIGSTGGSDYTQKRIEGVGHHDFAVLYFVSWI